MFDRDIKRGKLISDALHKDRRFQVLDHYTGDIFMKITSAGSALMKKFDVERYSPFTRKMTAAVREVTDNGIVFIDNSYWSNIGIPCSNLLIEVDGKKEPKQCFQPHGYDLMVDTPAYKYANNSRVGAIFAEHKRTQERLGIPVLVGEWGGGGEGTEWLPHVRYLLEVFEQNKWSYAYWHYSEGILDAPLSDVLARPYPKAVSGTVTDFVYDLEAETFTLTYDQDKVFDASTVIYTHKTPKDIVTDGEYTVEAIKNSNAAHVIIKTGVGKHNVSMKF